jgi:two-component system LytT family response regulator
MGQFEEIYGFYDPEEAYSFIKEKECDVLFMETEMKGVNCFVFINKLRKINKNIFFIILTEKEEYAYEALQKDVMDYILKPLLPDKITKTLKKYHRKV